MSESKVDTLFDFEDSLGLFGPLGRDFPHGLKDEDIEIVHNEDQKHFDAVGVVGLVETWFYENVG